MPKNKRFVLIIDDMWEDYPLEKVGVPNPTVENGCKLVLTTRSRDVCSQMECGEIIEIELLSKQEAVELFLDKVGKRVASDPKLREIVRQVTAECAGLPLAIVTVAGSLRDKMDLREWEVLLKELRDATSSISKKFTRILRFSYDRLKDYNLKECLLHCALYPEDHLIDRNMLIDQLIAQESVEEVRTRKQKMDKCHVMLNELVRNCMLIEAVNDIQEVCVKLHDSMRDMAIQIMRENPSRFMVGEAGMKKWDEQLEKVSLMGNNKIGVVEPPPCPRLSTLLINVDELKTIFEDFFTRMKGLRVLDLSGTRIQTLPVSVSYLENLTVLLLRNCTSLKCVPDLSELRNLIRLDMYNALITEFPRGLEKLAKLMYLDLGGVKVKRYPKRLLSGLSDLRYLSIVIPGGTELESAEELATLKKLETLKVVFMKYALFNAYFRSATERVCDFRFQVGYLSSQDEAPNSASLFCGPRSEDEGLYDLPILIPETAESLSVLCCFIAETLCRFTSIENITNLQILNVRACDIEYMLYSSPSVFPLFRNIKELELQVLPNLHALVGPEKDGTGSPPPLPLDAFSALKKLTLDECQKLKILFVLNKEASFPRLEEITIKDCEELEEIISYQNADAMIMNLPSLKSIILADLPKLKSAKFVANSLSHAAIRKCPELEEVASSRRPFIGC